MAAVEERMGAEFALGHHARVVTDLEGLVGLHPLRERLWALLIIALYQTATSHLAPGGDV